MTDLDKFIVYLFQTYSKALIPLYTIQDVKNIISLVYDYSLEQIDSALILFHASKQK